MAMTNNQINGGADSIPAPLTLCIEQELKRTGGGCVVACIKHRFPYHISCGFFDAEGTFYCINHLFTPVFEISRRGDVVVRGIHADPIAHALSVMYSFWGVSYAAEKSVRYNLL